MAAKSGHELFIDPAGEDHQRRIAGLGIGNAQACDEFALLAHLLEDAGKSRAAAMHHGDLVSVPRKHGNGARAAVQRSFVLQCGATKFDYEFHARPSASSNPNIRFIFSAACPAAPLSKLSRQDTTMHLRPSLANLNPISQ